MEKKEFETLNLKDQKSCCEGYWWYEDYKDNLKINKHNVVFDKDFNFKLRYVKGDKDCPGFVRIDFYINDNKDDSFGFYDYDKYADDPKDILANICHFISNCI